MAELADLIRERRRRRLEAAGLPFQEPLPLPPDYYGRCLGIPRQSVPGARRG
jgi:hypothetical protein